MDALLYTMQHQKTDMRYVLFLFYYLFLHWHWFVIETYAVPAFTAGENQQVARGLLFSKTCSLGGHDLSAFNYHVQQLSLKINLTQVTLKYFHFNFVIDVIFGKLLGLSLNLGLDIQMTTFEDSQ